GYEKRDGERGQVLATTVIAFVAICALVAVAADTGLFFDHRRRMQTGVDSAAMAGAEQLRRAASATQIESAAFKAAATNGFTNGGASVTATCGIVDDSSSSNAMNSSGGSSSVTATSIAVTGNVTGCCYSPTPQTGVPPEPDPFAQRAAPVFSGCDYTKFKVTGGTKILTPGVYCDGIDITGGSTVTFSPGLYVLNGGGLSVSGNSTLNGTGVTFYNTASGSNAYKPVSISGGTIGTLSAPTRGPMEAMLFFQDRAIRSSQTNTISGGS